MAYTQFVYETSRDPDIVRVYADSSVERYGMDDGASKITVQHVSNKILVLHISGTTGWKSLGVQGYYPAMYVVYGIIEQGELQTDRGKHYRDFQVVQITDFPVRKVRNG